MKNDKDSDLLKTKNTSDEYINENSELSESNNVICKKLDMLLDSLNVLESNLQKFFLQISELCTQVIKGNINHRLDASTLPAKLRAIGENLNKAFDTLCKQTEKPKHEEEPKQSIDLLQEEPKQSIDLLQEVVAKISQGMFEHKIDLTSIPEEYKTIGEHINKIISDASLTKYTLQEQTYRLEKAAARFENEKHIKSESLAHLACELKNPSNSILGFSRVLKDKTFGDLNEKQSSYVENIILSSQKILRRLDHTLALSNTTEGRKCEVFEEFRKHEESLEQFIHSFREVLTQANQGMFEHKIDLTSIPEEYKTIGEHINKIISDASLTKYTLQEQTYRLEKTVARLENEKHIKNNFFVHVANELKIPLNSILESSRVLKDKTFGDLNEKQSTYVEDIVSCVEKLLLLMNHVLTSSNEESVKFKLWDTE